jgi:hypothetical protein
VTLHCRVVFVGRFPVLRDAATKAPEGGRLLLGSDGLGQSLARGRSNVENPALWSSPAREWCLAGIGFCPDGRRERPRAIQAAPAYGAAPAGLIPVIAPDPGFPVRVGYGPWCPVSPRGKALPRELPRRAVPPVFGWAAEETVGSVPLR